MPPSRRRPYEPATATGAALPPIGGHILTGQLRICHAAHAPVILRHDLTADFFGIAEREAGWPDYHSFNVFPITAAALAQLRQLIADDPRFEIDTAHSAFGWIPRPKAYSRQLDLPIGQPALLATREEQHACKTAIPARAKVAPAAHAGDAPQAPGV